MDQLRERLAVSEALLSALRGAPGHPEMSEAESEAIVHAMRPVKLLPEAMAEMITAVRKLGLLRNHESAALTALSKKIAVRKPSDATGTPTSSASACVSSAPTATPGVSAPAHVTSEAIDTPYGPGKTQNFEAIVNYWPSEVWDAMARGSVIQP